MYISNHENNVPSRLSPQRFCGNSCTCVNDVHHVPQCMSCHKAIVVITGRTHCFYDSTYIYICDIYYIYISYKGFGKKELKEFSEVLNSYHPTMKFTARETMGGDNDIEVIKKRNQLITDLYIKPTDTHQYIHSSSCRKGTK